MLHSLVIYLTGFLFFFLYSLLKNYGFVLPECKAIRIQEQNITASQLSLPVLWSFLSGPPRLHGPKGKGVIQAISCVSANCPQNASHLLLCNVIFRCFYFFMNQGFFHLFSVSLHSLKNIGCCGQTHIMLHQNSKNNMDYTVFSYIVPGFFLWNSSFKPDCFGIPRVLCGVSGSSDVIWSVFCVVWEPEEHFALAALIGNPF